jgi:hypothetical protein
MEAFDKNYKHGDHGTGSRIGMSFFIYVGIFVTLNMILAVGLFFFKYTKESFLYQCATGGVIFWLVALGIGIAELIKYIKKKRIKYTEEGYRIYEEKKPNLLVTGIKSWYEKNCPRIEWADLKNTNQN